MSILKLFNNYSKNNQNLKIKIFKIKIFRIKINIIICEGKNKMIFNYKIFKNQNKIYIWMDRAKKKLAKKNLHC